MPRQSNSTSLFGRRLREARLRIGIAQDKLGVLIGMDESCSSARISRYETGIHEPPIATVEKLAIALNVPMPYFFCDDDQLAELLVHYTDLSNTQKNQLLEYLEILVNKAK
jgi:transcriptional regulator with XRE-family HTH domain